jgi:hypothetical protein
MIAIVYMGDNRRLGQGGSDGDVEKWMVLRHILGVSG